MFKVQTAEGTKYLVMLTGARSYTIHGRRISRGETMTVTERNRKYLISTGQFTDYDPTPAAPPERDMPPQFGVNPATRVDLSDFTDNNPPISQTDAAALAANGGDFGEASAEVEEKKEPKAAPRRSVKVGAPASEKKEADKSEPADDATVIA